MRKLTTFLLLLLVNIMIPLNVLAYSDYILAGGQNIGIQINSDGILIVGTYKIGGDNPALDANLKIGDKIIITNHTSQYAISTVQNTLDRSAAQVTSVAENQIIPTKNLYRRRFGDRG
jgi:hypothetical protein